MNTRIPDKNEFTQEELDKFKPYFNWYNYSACGTNYHDRPMNEEENISCKFYAKTVEKINRLRIINDSNPNL